MTQSPPLTCSCCLTRREGPPFEEYLHNSSETMAWCLECRAMTKHWVGDFFAKRAQMFSDVPNLEMGEAA